MNRIKIKHFGPIKEGFRDKNGSEWIELKKVTAFIGNQGSGKSTLAKVISTLSWLEKAINRSEVNIANFNQANFYELFEYQRIHNYFNSKTIIDYIGDRISVNYNDDLKILKIELLNNSSYAVPQIMYVPAERNFLSVVKNAYGIKNLPDTLYTFAEEFRKSQYALNNRPVELPVDGLRFQFNEEDDTSVLIGNDYALDLTESSSGYQSLIPLFLVTKYLSDELEKEDNVLQDQLNVEQSVRRSREISAILKNENFDEIQKDMLISEVNKKYINTCFINIVEEPEQNLFPTSQQTILNTLIRYNNKRVSNRLIITTHSPYLINYLTLSVEAAVIIDKLDIPNHWKLESIVPLDATIKPNDLIIYELDEIKGSISELDSYHGLPSDENKLNYELAQGNEYFSKLIEIEQKL